MDDYIKRETAIKLVKGTGYADQIKNNLLFILRTIPALTVVTCGECIHLNREATNMNGFYRCDRYDAWQDKSDRVHMPLDGFCSYGDRGTNNEEAEKALEGMNNG